MMLKTSTLTKALVLLLIPKKLTSAQMFSDYGIPYIRFKLPLGKTRKDLLVCWKWIFSDIPERKKGMEHFLIKSHRQGFPGGAVVENPPANAGDTGSSPGPGRSHMPRSN